MRPRALVALVLTAALAGCRSAPVAPTAGPRPMRDSLAAIVDRGLLSGAQWGVLAVDLATGDTLLARNAATRFLPASTMKLATSIAALDLLGADFRWHTDLWSSAPIDSTAGVLRGDLVVPGTGDPTLSPRFYPEPPGPLDLLGSTLRDLGVARVTGALVVDASTWDSTTVRASWMVDDLPFDYGSTGGAFALNDGETHVEVRGGASPAEAPTIDWWPRGERGFVRSALVTTGDGRLDVSASYLPESRVLELTGTVPVNAVDTLAFATRDPVRQAAAGLYRALTERGTAIDGGWRVEWQRGVRFGHDCTTGSVPPCTEGRPLRGLGSPPLIDVVRADLGPSQNWIAEQIERTLATASGATPGWPEGTAAAKRSLVAHVGIDSLDLRIVDGSGLSTQDLLTPRALVAMLRFARGRPWAAGFQNALPQPGDAGSTLETRLTDLRGRLFAKTGTLTNVAALAGYVTDARGRDVAFAVLVNASNLPGAAARQAIDAVVRLIAYGR